MIPGTGENLQAADNAMISEFRPKLQAEPDIDPTGARTLNLAKATAAKALTAQTERQTQKELADNAASDFEKAWKRKYLMPVGFNLGGGKAQGKRSLVSVVGWGE